MKSKALLLLIFLVAIFFRFYGILWDQGAHFHPDERMLVMVTDRIHLFNQLNPDFFNYGSLPVYIVRGVSQIIDWVFKLNVTNYDGLLVTGRLVSTFCDVMVLLLVYKIAHLLFENKRVALWSSFLYAVAFFPIQNSHFFIVDTFLNLFITILVYLLIHFYKKPANMYVPLIALTYAACITTKVSAIIFTPVVVGVLVLCHDTKRLDKVILHSVLRLIVFAVITVNAAYVFMPFGFIEHKRFFEDISLQLKMNSDPYIFPYTLQYVGTTPYLYYLKNIFLWGLGPLTSFFTFIGGYILIKQIRFRKILNIAYLWTNWNTKKLSLVLFSGMYLLYFVFMGRSAVKFMRYMLLLYPFFAVLAGYGISTLLSRAKKHQKISNFAAIALVVLIALWTVAFSQIYSVADTRHQATDWILKNIPGGSTIAVEHWDDRIPVRDEGQYQYIELPLYERPDNEPKWEDMNRRLQLSDYVVLASNRLYVPLQRLNDCQRYTSCYPLTAQYYQKLFHNELQFEKVAEFTSYPRLTVGPLKIIIPDDSADESFTVYDHPKIMIFKKKTAKT